MKRIEEFLYSKYEEPNMTYESLQKGILFLSTMENLSYGQREQSISYTDVSSELDWD